MQWRFVASVARELAVVLVPVLASQLVARLRRDGHPPAEPATAPAVQPVAGPPR